MTNRFIQYVLLRLRQHVPGGASQPLGGRARSMWLRTTCLCAIFGAMAAAPVSLAGSGPTILVLGDSISAAYGIQRERGWVAKLADRVSDLDRPWRVVNASLSGETTGGGLARLPDALTAHRPDVVVIELGGNDGLRGYPVDSIRDNLTAMVRVTRGAGSAVLLVGIEIPPNYGPRYTRAFADVFREVAESEDVPLVPFILEQVALEPGLMQADGIHPTAEAQPLLLETVWPELAALLEQTPSPRGATDHRLSR
jgi:acyl-CoA thioesterase I